MPNPNRPAPLPKPRNLEKAALSESKPNIQT